MLGLLGYIKPQGGQLASGILIYLTVFSLGVSFAPVPFVLYYLFKNRLSLVKF
jgi:hypothetical protein